MDVIGRQDELQVIGSFLEFVMRGPVALVLRGEAGIGKTTLWEAGLDQAKKRGYTVLACRAAQSEARLSYSSVCDLLAGFDEQTLGRLPAPQREALEVVLLRSEKPHLTVDHRSVATAFLTVLSQLSQRSPVVLAVDDFQWVDRTSAQAIEFATRRMTGRIGVLASIRASQGADERAVRLARPDEVRRFAVGPMSLGAIHHLLRERIGRTYPRPTLVRIHEVSGGNPFFALEIVQVLGDGSVLGPQTRFPATLAELTRTRLEGLDTDVREALLGAAALASPSIDVLDRVLGCDSYKLLERAEDLGIVQVIDNHVRFTHPILASGIYGMASPAKRRAMHRRLADAGLELEERARHLALAVSTGPETVAALDAAAEIARRRGAPAAAAELLELALRVGADDANRKIRAAACHYETGDPARARSLLDAAIRELPQGVNRAEALRLLASVRIYDDSYGDAADLLERALPEAAGDAALQCQIELDLAFVQFNQGRFAEAIPHADRALATAELTGSSRLIAPALAIVTIFAFMNGQGLREADLERALSLEDHESAANIFLHPSLIASLLWMWSGRLDEALARLYNLRRRCLDKGAETDLIFIGFHLAMLECWRGDLASAKTVANDAYERALQMGTEVPLGLALTAQAYAAAYAGDAAEARRAANAALDICQRAILTVETLVPLGILGFVDLSVGDAQAAASRLGPMAMTA